MSVSVNVWIQPVSNRARSRLGKGPIQVSSVTRKDFSTPFGDHIVTTSGWEGWLFLGQDFEFFEGDY